MHFIALPITLCRQVTSSLARQQWWHRILNTNKNSPLSPIFTIFGFFLLCTIHVILNWEGIYTDWLLHFGSVCLTARMPVTVGLAWNLQNVMHNYVVITPGREYGLQISQRKSSDMSMLHLWYRQEIHYTTVPHQYITSNRYVNHLTMNWQQKITEQRIRTYHITTATSLATPAISILTAVWFKLTATVTEMTVNGNKSNPLTVTVTEKFH